MTKILVAYYSRTGFTRTVGRQIATLCHADLESIKSLAWHHHGFGYARSALGAIFHWENSTRRTKHDPKDYDIVAIGTPVWCWNMASPVRAYINDHRGKFKQVAFFCTSEGSGQSKVMRDLRALTGLAPIATMSMTDQEIQGKRHQDRIREFAAAVERAASSQDSPPVLQLSATDAKSFGVANHAR